MLNKWKKYVSEKDVKTMTQTSVSVCVCLNVLYEHGERYRI